MSLSARAVLRVLSSLAGGPAEAARALDAGTLAARAAEFFGLEASVLARPTRAALVKDRSMLPLGTPARLETLAGAVLAHWPGERLALTTSGSTGEPQLHVREMLWLAQETRFLAGLFTGARRVVSLVPSHHIYGFLFAVLLPETLGIPVLDLEAASLTALQGILEPEDIVLGFPFLWKKWGELGVRYPRRVTGVTSTGPCRPEIIQAALTGGLSRMAEIHGSTETGGLGYRFCHDEPYRLMDHWSIAVSDKATLWRAHPDGCAPVRFSLPDEFQWAGERLYRPAGRRDKAVQIAGVNVYPEHVRRVLLDHPLVKEAAVRPMLAHEGDRLKAYIVVSDSAVSFETLIRTLREYLSGVLSAPETPRNFTIGRALPKNALGKDMDWGISPCGEEWEEK